MGRNPSNPPYSSSIYLNGHTFSTTIPKPIVKKYGGGDWLVSIDIDEGSLIWKKEKGKKKIVLTVTADGNMRIEEDEID